MAVGGLSFYELLQKYPSTFYFRISGDFESIIAFNTFLSSNNEACYSKLLNMAQVLVGLMQFLWKFIAFKCCNPFPQNSPSPEANQIVTPWTIPAPETRSEVMKEEYKTGERYNIKRHQKHVSESIEPAHNSSEFNGSSGSNNGKLPS